MTTQAGGAKILPILGAVLVLLIGAALWTQLFGTSAPASVLGNDSLLRVQGSLATARQAVAGDNESLEKLAPAIDQLRNPGAGWSEDQRRSLSKLADSLGTIGNGSDDPLGVLSRAGEDLGLLVVELNDRSYALEAALTLQREPVVTAQLERLRLLGDGARRDVLGIATSPDPTATTQALLDAEIGMGQIVRGFQQGAPELGLRAVSGGGALEALSALNNTVEAITAKIRDVAALGDGLASLARARTQLDDVSVSLGASGVVTTSAEPGGNSLLIGLLAGALAVFLAMGVIYLRSANMRRAAQLQAEQTERDQQAIMRLLDELSSLADGDLTVNATVTEDITGAIADSINFAIEALRELVTTIKDSAIMVDASAKQTDATAQQLAEASASQSKQLEAASQAISQMTSSLDEVSGNAERSSDVARHSVDVAHKGGDAVRRTIEGMNTIRETIQDTSKRIKRLGESSQEIGNIVELINDIAEQTNILALNASIQASMAGEAGRGFSVVADEVQRLAERSANATKQIEVLVRTIQADTNEAVVSMERSTTDVVGGALLAENAGAALEEIEQVSNQIAQLVQSISESSRVQGKSAEAVTASMDVLQQINSETANSTSETAGAIRKLAELAAQLRDSAAGFRLPEAESVAEQTPAVDFEPAPLEDAELDSEPPESASTEEPAEDNQSVEFIDQRTA